MNRLIFAILLLIFPTIQGCLQVEDENEDSTIRLATTTSLRDSGLLAEILPDFTQQTGVEVDVIAVGSGAAMTLAENDDVDVLIVHDPEREIQFIEDGLQKIEPHLLGIDLSSSAQYQCQAAFLKFLNG